MDYSYGSDVSPYVNFRMTVSDTYPYLNEKLSLLYRRSLLIPLSFPFLPVQRIALYVYEMYSLFWRSKTINIL
jgi:hypothetical protein